MISNLKGDHTIQKINRLNMKYKIKEMISNLKGDHTIQKNVNSCVLVTSLPSDQGRISIYSSLVDGIPLTEAKKSVPSIKKAFLHTNIYTHM